MKFVFPQNYNLKTKIFGFVDYQSAVLDAIWMGIVFLLVNIFFNSLDVQICVFIVLVFPVVILSVVGINGENIIYVLMYVLRYTFRQKVFLYDKTNIYY